MSLYSFHISRSISLVNKLAMPFLYFYISTGYSSTCFEFGYHFLVQFGVCVCVRLFFLTLSMLISSSNSFFRQLFKVLVLTIVFKGDNLLKVKSSCYSIAYQSHFLKCFYFVVIFYTHASIYHGST